MTLITLLKLKNWNCMFSSTSFAGKILIHCRTGISLSPAMVIGALMINKKLDVRDVFRHVRSRRIIQPNASFREQLCELNDQLFYESEKT